LSLSRSSWTYIERPQEYSLPIFIGTAISRRSPAGMSPSSMTLPSISMNVSSAPLP
jgi:hypothetical protein